MPDDAARAPVAPAGGAPALRKSDLTRQRILEAAARVFRHRGYSGTRLSEIAEIAGMQVGSLYYHFRSREALVAEVMAIGLAQTEEAFRAALADLPADAGHAARIRAAVETHVLQLIEPGDFPAAVFKLIAEVPPDLREAHRAGERAFGRMWRDLLEAARADGALRADADISILRMLIVGAMNWTIEWYRPEVGPARRVAEQCAALVLNGILRRD